MAASSYDPCTFEFVARMGRIPPPDSSRRRKEKIPVMFRIPDPPEPEILTPEVRETREVVLQQRSSSDVPLVAVYPKPETKLLPSPTSPAPQRSTPSPPSQRSTPSPPRRSRRKREHAKKSKEKKHTREHDHDDKPVTDEKEAKRQQDLEYTAQQLVNQTLLEHELRQLHRRERMLKSIRRRIKRQVREEDPGVSVRVEKKQPEVSEELMGYVRRELERLMPIVKETKK